MKTRILLIGLVSTLLFFSDCDFGIGDWDFGSGGPYYPVYYDSLNSHPTYNPYYKSSLIEINPDSIDFYGNLSATLYFSAIADTTVIIDSINSGLDDMENVEQRFYNRKIDFHIVNITTDDCMEDISIKPDTVSFTMEKDQVYVFCFQLNNLEWDSFSFYMVISTTTDWLMNQYHRIVAIFTLSLLHLINSILIPPPGISFSLGAMKVSLILSVYFAVSYHLLLLLKTQTPLGTVFAPEGN